MSMPSATPHQHLSESEAPLPPHVAVPPYAAPALRGAGEGVSARLAAPYVPAAWRVSRPSASVPPVFPVEKAFPTPAGVESQLGVHVVAEPLAPEQEALDGSLPWIEAFLSTTPVVPMAAVVAVVAAAGATGATIAIAATAAYATPWQTEAQVDTEPTTILATDLSADTAGEMVVESEADVAPATGIVASLVNVQEEDWPLTQAASEFDALTEQLEALAPPMNTEPAVLFAEPAPPRLLPAWSDEDMVDIMPVRQPLFTPRSLSAQPAHAIGAPSTNRDDNAEAAALTLELLAGRVRAGDLPLAGYEPRMGDAAALVAALAALLGVKLR